MRPIGVRGPPARMGLAARPDADANRKRFEDVRAPPPVSASARCAALPVRMEPGSKAQCGRGRPRTPPVSASARCADLPVRMEPGSKAGCGREPQAVRGRPRTPRFRRLRGARTSRSAWSLAVRPNADANRKRFEDVRAPPRVRRCILRLVRARRPVRGDRTGVDGLGRPTRAECSARLGEGLLPECPRIRGSASRRVVKCSDEA